jgi:4-hydroxyisophthalate hydroxylase
VGDLSRTLLQRQELIYEKKLVDNMTETYDVIIVGCGPTGAALGIELGMNNVKTLILEKYEHPLLSPRAQSLNERSMELFMRWGLADKLREQSLLPKNYPMRGVWCSKLNGVTYATAGSASQFEENTTAQKSVRLPLYITENILRSRLNAFKCVTVLHNHAVESVVIKDSRVEVVAKNKVNQLEEKFIAKYAVGCDGANSTVRENVKIPFKALAPKRRVINLLFESFDLQGKITVEKGFLYYLLENKTLAAVGPIDINKGIWYAQIVYSGNEKSIDEVDVDHLMEALSGIQFTKKILNKHFWDMQIQCADHFIKDNRVFLVGDAAHAFAPTGGFGLNTGLGDVTNLAWKLVAVLHHNISQKLLSTYESERRPICVRNLKAAEKNAHDAAMVRTEFPPDKDLERFAQENARIAKQHVHSGGITLGYTYNQDEEPMKQSVYIPTTKSGYFLPNKLISGKSIYEKLSPTRWTLIVCGKEKIKIKIPQLKICHVAESTYPSRYILIRPDWHIALAENEISENEIKNYFKT